MYDQGTRGKFRGFVCVVKLDATGDSDPLLEFEDDIPESAGFGWLGKTRPDLAVDRHSYYWFDHKNEFVPDVAWQKRQPWVRGVDKVSPAIFRGVRCKFLPNRGRTAVVEFDEDQRSFATWLGTQKELEDPPGIMGHKYYRYVRDDTEDLVILTEHGRNCCECNSRNEHAEANLTGDLYICWGCSTSYRWKYEGRFLPGHRYHDPLAHA